MMLLINFKNYLTGEKAVKLAKTCKKIDKNIVLGVSLADLYRISNETRMKCFVQHVDYQDKGRNTGFNTVESVKANGGRGVFINHSEHRLNYWIIKKTVKRAKELNLEVILFAKDVKEGQRLNKLKPSYICIEPPKLIAGKVSVSEANPELIKDSVKKIKNKILVGAGVNNRNDVLTAKKLGAKGVLVSSAVCRSNNPSKILKELRWK